MNLQSMDIGADSTLIGPFNLRRLISALVCTAMVYALTHMPQQAIPEVLAIRGFDKLVHGLAYAVIALTFLAAVATRRGWRLLLIVMLGVAAIGAVDELTQSWVGRACSVWDFAADLIGIGTAWMIVMRARLREHA